MIGLIKGLKLEITGIVQGVGFRPFIYSLAVKNNLTGWVLNSSSGVEIEVNGCAEDLALFVAQIKTMTPPLARIDDLHTQFVEPAAYAHFEILTSEPRPGQFVPVSPDVSICDDCARELFDPTDRRYRYPFINCTNCGPRFSIVKDIPYDRPLTTMAGFRMCPDCDKEYRDPLDRRFHAQPTACPSCGPQLQFHTKKGLSFAGEPALQEARAWLRKGKILAIKGLGGYHLACDATNAEAVTELRRRKRRSDKPFGLMAYDVTIIRKQCHVSQQEEELLQTHQHPIVILERRDGSTIAADAAPHQKHWGMMLPYTPLHLLLLQPQEGFPEVLVMTSGNLSEEPIAYEDESAYSQLDNLADGFLVHDRPIHMRVDDSVARVVLGSTYLMRRARGYAPDAVVLPFSVPPILAVGPELKNTFCLGQGRYAFPSHHIGDLENYETLQSFELGVQHYENLFKVNPQAIACDLHPDYLSTRYALERSQKMGIPLIQVQHHHAHLAACLADNGWCLGEKKAIGIIFDGTGLGTDGMIWGGEVLVGNMAGYQRRFHLEEMPLPGGEAAIRNPLRIGLAYLWKANIVWSPDLPPTTAFTAADSNLLAQQLEKKINTPITTSMGRLFDAVASLTGVCHHANYEGQAAIELENSLDPMETGLYEFDIHHETIGFQSVLSEIVRDLKNGIDKATISAQFHNGVIDMIVRVCHITHSENGLTTVALSGGVWQNMYLLKGAVQKLRQAGFEVLFHHQVPTNDGGVSLGQLVVCAAQMVNQH